MNELLKYFGLKFEIISLVNTYFDPPIICSIEQLGFFKLEGQLHTFIKYKDLDIEEPLYDKNVEYIIDILDDIRIHFENINTLDNCSKEEFRQNIKCIYRHVKEQIYYYEQF